MTKYNNKSDYTKAFMDLVELLPAPNRSDVNISLFNNLFNRFLTKQEIEKVAGYIGRGNKNALTSRQIQENSVHRQAYQLQPILYDKIGSIEHMASWKDIQNELDRLGVDIADFANWGAVKNFNWVPPIDINKLINYGDYYWVDTAGSNPQYITIRSRCAVATARNTFWENIIDQYGSAFPIEDVLGIDDRSTLPVYPIVTISTGLGEVHVTGDATDYLSEDEFFDISGTVSNDGTYQIASSPIYDGTQNRTIFDVSGLVATESLVGNVLLRRFDKIVLSATTEAGSPPSAIVPDGDYTGIMQEGFIMFLRNMNNPELNNTFVEVVSSVADIDNKRTIVTINLVVTDNTFENGEASLEEQQSTYLAEKNCQCGVLGGWDDGILWDDNPANPLWGDIENAAGDPGADGISDHQNLLDRISNPTAPVAAPSDPTKEDLWYDTAGNKLYQWSTTLLVWSIIWNNFNLIISATKGFSLWDETSACDLHERIEAADQWTSENKWQHKNDVTNFASVKRATQPIIEYDWDLELNEWTYVDYRWSYRSENDAPFVETDNTPPTIELESITWWELEDTTDVNNTTIILDSRYGDMTTWFVPGKQMYIDDGTTIAIYTVDYSEYKSIPGDYPHRTYVTLTTKPSVSTGDLNDQKPNTFEIYPIATTAGDIWQGYGVHWLFLGVKDALPVPHQVDNPYIPIKQGSIGIPVDFPVGSPNPDYEYNVSLFSQSYTILTAAGMSTFELLDDIEYLGSPGVVVETRSLRRKALFGFDDIRVYISDIFGENLERQFGNYDEIGEAVLNVVGVDYGNNEFVVNANITYDPNVATDPFSKGDIVRLRSNTGIGTCDFVVSDDAPSGPNKVKVNVVGSPSNFSTISVSGEISNVTKPLPSEDFTNDENVTVYVMGVTFFETINPGVNVIIQVGAATIDEVGNHFNKVRTIEDNVLYNINGDIPVSQIQYRLIDQVKTKINQYPLFDIFNVDGTPAFRANQIFGYKTSPDASINLTGFRIVYDAVDNVYEFDQFILDDDDGELFAYRDYSNKQEDFWYNPETNTLNFWHSVTWSERTSMGDQYRKAIISDIEPSLRERDINGLYWYSPIIGKLFKRNTLVTPNVWNEVAPIDKFVTDINLQTIWKAGLNGEIYTPQQVDWVRRSEEEYDTEMQDFVGTRTAELLVEDPSLTEAEATAQATEEWYAKQSNHLSTDGTWIGDWEIPDPLYYNHLHENRKCLTSRELLTHFTTIIEEQPLIPGYIGTKDGMFNLLPMNSVNYSLGGTIKEFNDGFDTMLSSTFVNNVTPRSLIEFGHDQYEGLLNSLKEIFRENAILLLTNVETDNILDLSSYVADEVIEQHELNDQTAFVYGDTTTFTDVTGGDDLGVRNWIATLPYVNLVTKHIPERIIDDEISLDEVVHHDGHRNGYELSSATGSIISQLVVLAPDTRTTSNTMGESSSNLPPNTVTAFESSFGTPISNREGVYWYYIPGNTAAVLYRYVVAESGTTTPSSTYPDGTLWMDLTTGLEVLRVKTTDFLEVVTWDIVNGLTLGDGRLHNGTNPANLNTATVSAWEEIDLDSLLNDTIFELENRLYSNVPTFQELSYDFDNLETENPEKYLEYLEEAFLDYVSQSQISTPYRNLDFNSADAFTWNYLRSASGGGISVSEADGLTNSFILIGDQTSSFTPSTNFFVKNSDVNDGTWTTVSAVYNIGNDDTTVFVTGDVVDSLKGIIYSGVLPSSLNDGSESGGDWRDLYSKVYGTPYPHAEPWVLQGYVDKPDWWDEEYLNDDVNQWGDRTWKYKHGFEIVSSDNSNYDSIDGTHGIFGIDGDFHTNFISSQAFTIDNSVDHAGIYIVGQRDTIIKVNTGVAGVASVVISDVPPDPAAAIYLPGMKFSIVDNVTFQIEKTYTIRNVNHALNEFTITVEEEIATGDIVLASPSTKIINGALYDPATNLTEIKISGLVNSSTPSGRIIGLTGSGFGMWENIRVGVIPPLRSYPNGVVSITGDPALDTVSGLSVPLLPTFNYFSVNIGNLSVSADGGATTYDADAIFPPYWNYINVFTATPSSLDLPIRSLYNDFSTEIISPNANYTFGDSGPVEWEWRVSSQFLYDQLTVAYRIDPVRYVSSTFGFNYTEIGGLQVDRDNKNTPSHTRTDFHGEVVNNEQFKVDGLNQWYVNFNRYAGYDASFSDFRELWTGWTAPLTYQFASFVDTPSLSVAHRYVDISNFDYNITSKRGPGVEDFWMDAFKVSIINIPYNIARYNNELDWRFELNTNLHISRNIDYYDVHNYQFYANTSDECWLYTWEIQEIDTFDKTFSVHGDQTYVFSSGSQFDIIGSTGNDATYDVIISSYDTITDRTTILVNNTILSAVKDGLLKANYRDIPWETGDTVYLSTAELLPIPLLGDTVNGLTKYFIIKISNTIFKLADTPSDALTGNAIDITSSGRNDQFIGEVISTFLADNGKRTNTNWRFYALDKSNVLNFSTPHEVQGMQTLVNMIQGHASYLEDAGWRVNDDKSALDPDSSRIVSWQVEAERFITYAYSQRVIREQVNDRYPVTVDISTDVLTFNTTNETFVTGDTATILSTNSVYPTPLARGIHYYVIRDTMETFRLAATKQNALDGIAIDILSDAGIGDLSITTPKTFKTLISDFEINPFRNAIWINPPRGIVSNILTGPVEDIRTTQLIFNQDGSRINDDQLRVYRQDKQTKISVVDAVNSSANIPLVSSEYTLLHLGGLHLFIDVYEHAMILNNYTSVGNLLYDPFIGLNVTKYEMLFNRQPEFTQRPNVGGYAIETFFNQGANLNENIEAGVESLRHAYDTYNTLESNLMTQYSRKALGYEGTTEYLSNLNLSEKSQFIFWRGQIQNKGSLNAVNAFVNSRRFIDAKVDDFWAIKLGEFGSVKELEFPEMFVTTVDARSNELRLEFIDNDVDEASVEETFTPIKMSYQERWYNQPDQIEVLRNNGKVMYFDMKAKNKLEVIPSGSPLVFEQYIRHDLDSDSVEVTQFNNSTQKVETLTELTHYEIINNNIIKIISVPHTTSLFIWGMVFNDDAQNPARIIDRESEVQITPIEFWDPARGKHYSNAIHNVDLQNDLDPAEYNNTPQSATDSDVGIWKESFVGTSWLNTENLDYVPYYSSKMIPDTTERFRSWGQLADWSEVVIYEWVESDVIPSEWDVIAAEEEGDRTIVEHLRKSGTARKVLFEKSGSNWIPAVNKFEELYAATDGVAGAGGYTFTIDVDNPDVDFKKTGSPEQVFVDFYINGKLFSENVALQQIGGSPFTYKIFSTNVKENDVIRVVQPILTDQDEIDAEIAAGNMQQEYEYTEVQFYDVLGNIFSKYYFWVGDKVTKPTGKNRTMPILEAQTQLSSIPAAHMFFQKVEASVDVVTEDIQVPRSELHPEIADPLAVSYEFGLTPLSTNVEDILVEVNGSDLPSNGLTYIVGGSPLAVSILDTGTIVLTGSDEVKISYTGVDNKPIEIPRRFTQAVIRGLQGVVNADDRYTIRFTRNFTLRDMLDVENENVGSMDLKNLHEEWKIFRQEQQTHIDRWQWDKITESIVGYTLSDTSIRVPSFERELYDEKFNTDTQYGLGDGQAFVNGTLALASIISYLIDPEVDFTPLDINAFFTDNEFDTPEGVIIAMNEIYNTFSFTDVNRMYFSVLKDAFTTKAKYPGIFKTSMISLHGIRPFQTSGVFDD